MSSLLFLIVLGCQAQDDVDSLMAKVAENLQKGSEVRKQYVYTEKTYTRLIRTNRQVAREERRQYLVTPTRDNTERQLVLFEGKYQKGKALLPYDSKEFRTKEMDIDGELIEDLADDLIADSKHRDGMHMDLFPFLPDRLAAYTFKLVKTEQYRGRKVHRIAFEGKTQAYPWIGDTLIDAEDLHPVAIQTNLNWKLPFVVRKVLGTNLQQTGLSLTYTRLEPGIWFPASYGTEMRLDLLFAYKRVITMSMETRPDPDKS